MITNIKKKNLEKQLNFYFKGDNVTVYNTPNNLSSTTITRIEIITPRMFLMDIPPLQRLYHGYCISEIVQCLEGITF